MIALLIAEIIFVVGVEATENRVSVDGPLILKKKKDAHVRCANFGNYYTHANGNQKEILTN